MESFNGPENPIPRSELCPVRHIYACLNVNAIGCRMQNKQMKVMRDY
jgi:hypothetical protein